MGVTTTIAACICGLLTAASLVQEAGWRGIVPLHSTRADVERLIGPPMKPWGITYDLQSERVNVGYSHGGCEKGEEWNVASGTVTMITVYPQTKVMLADLKIDTNRFKKFLDPQIEDSIFTNEAEGMSIRTTSNGEVISIQYFPAAMDNHLRCPAAPQGGGARKFDEYSNIPFSDEKARLDNFAIHLRKELQLKGYIIVYGGQKTPSGKIQARAKRAKNYLVKVRGIEATRIVTMGGGRRDRLEVELYALPSSMSPPTPNPNRK